MAETDRAPSREKLSDLSCLRIHSPARQSDAMWPGASQAQASALSRLLEVSANSSDPKALKAENHRDLFETKSQYVDQGGLTEICLPLTPKCWH